MYLYQPIKTLGVFSVGNINIDHKLFNEGIFSLHKFVVNLKSQFANQAYVPFL